MVQELSTEPAETETGNVAKFAGQMNLIGEFIGTGLNTSLYSTLLDQWLNAPSPEILGGTFENLRFV